MCITDDRSDVTHYCTRSHMKLTQRVFDSCLLTSHSNVSHDIICDTSVLQLMPCYHLCIVYVSHVAQINITAETKLRAW